MRWRAWWTGQEKKTKECPKNEIQITSQTVDLAAVTLCPTSADNNNYHDVLPPNEESMCVSMMLYRTIHFNCLASCKKEKQIHHDAAILSRGPIANIIL
jgi:hypothetical protein